MSETVSKVVIAGGGAAGWLTACLLASNEALISTGVKITLVESPDIRIIGVGEGTWPTMRSTLRRIGLSETTFMRECSASFKQASQFNRWVTGADDDTYYHPFTQPTGFGQVNLVSGWQDFCQEHPLPFAEAMTWQKKLCDWSLAPKTLDDPEYGGPVNYAYHLDAGKFAELLRKHACGKLGVEHVMANISNVILDSQGNIAELELAEAGSLPGDLFVDCTGFASLLLGKALGVGFIDTDDILFANRALALQVPYENENSPIKPMTLSTAHEAGWIWDIGLTSRRGIGCVYSSAHLSDEKAEQILRSYAGQQHAGSEARLIPFRSGYRKRFWHRNCVAIGLSAGFLEPLEASALMLVELSAHMLADEFPCTQELLEIKARRFNDTFAYRWERIIDFLKLHYVLSKRQEAFWQDNRRPESVPQSLQDRLAGWAYRAPNDYDFDHRRELFPPASYQYILYGMGFLPRSFEAVPDSLKQQFREVLGRNVSLVNQARKQLPAHRLLLNQLGTRGFSTA